MKDFIEDKKKTQTRASIQIFQKSLKLEMWHQNDAFPLLWFKRLTFQVVGVQFVLA